MINEQRKTEDLSVHQSLRKKDRQKTDAVMRNVPETSSMSTFTYLESFFLKSQKQPPEYNNVTDRHQQLRQQTVQQKTEIH